MASPIQTPICIIGAGPSGATASMFLSQRKIPHILLDKASFPRDKICGDGLTLEVMHILKLLDPTIIQEIQGHKDIFLPSWGAKIISPNGSCFRLVFDKEQLPHSPIFTSRRLDFDLFLQEHIPSPYANIHLETTVKSLERKDGKVIVTAEKAGQTFQIESPLIMGADGERSIVSRQLGNGNKKMLAHTYASVRGYFSGVTGMGADNDLEFFFLKDLLPGYLWIFPMPNGHANVGVIMLSEQVSKKKINLRELFASLIATHPLLAKRFENAVMAEPIKGWGLPLSSVQKPLAGDNFYLLGDAGSLIEPFSGKGIGIGMISGRVAAEFAAQALDQNDFSGNALMAYSHAMYRRYGREWKMLHRMQKIYRHATLINMMNVFLNLPLINRPLLKRINDWTARWM